jgi:hypothetical protein
MSSTQPPPGEVAPSPLRLRPLAVSEILDESIRIYRRNFGLILVLALISVLPGLVYNLLTVQAMGGGAGRSPFATTSGTANPLAAFNFAYIALGGLIVLIASPISSGILYQATIDIAAGYRPSAGTVLSQVLRRYLPILGVVVIGWLCIIPVITCVGIVLTIWLRILISLALPAMFAEGKGTMAALQRSADLVRNSWWRIFGILILAQLMVFVFSFAASLVAQLVVALIPGLGVQVQASLSQVAAAAATSLVAPVVPIVACLLYFDRRVRSEALELDILAMQASQAHVVPPAPPPAPAI